MKLRILCEKLLIISQRFFGVPGSRKSEPSAGIDQGKLLLGTLLPAWRSGKPHTAKDGTFRGWGPDWLRRANITWRQEVGGSSNETSKIAGHASTKITEEYTVVQLKRQDELTCRIQEKLGRAAKQLRPLKPGPEEEAAWALTQPPQWRICA
jgi:hypothetical protein